jgi:hypothetical protein
LEFSIEVQTGESYDCWKVPHCALTQKSDVSNDVGPDRIEVRGPDFGEVRMLQHRLSVPVVALDAICVVEILKDGEDGSGVLYHQAGDHAELLDQKPAEEANLTDQPHDELII